MKLALSQVPSQGCDRSFVVADNPDGLTDDAQWDGPIQVRVHARYASGALQITGQAASRFTLTCSRCLTSFVLPVSCEFDITYSAALPQLEAEEIELVTSELTVYPLLGDEVDLAELAREQVLLEIPMAPLCHPECKGLCPHCGEGLGTCGCQAPVDPRFAALKKLL